MNEALTVFLEADASGLTSVFSSSMRQVVGFVDKLNSSQINWKQIMAGTLDTTLITTIASTFSLAIVQAVQFQQAALNLNNLATPATNSLSSSMGELGSAGAGATKSALAAGQTVGATTSAFEAFTKAGLDASAAQYAVQEASGLSYAGLGKMSDIVSQLSPLFNEWGVKTMPQVQDALTGLGNASKNGLYTFQELVNMLTPQGAILKTRTNISDTSLALAELSKNSTMSKSTISSMFSTIATSSGQGVNSMLNNLLGIGDVGKIISSGPDGLITVFEAISTKIKSAGPAIQGVIANLMGLSEQQMSAMASTSRLSFDSVITNFDRLRTHLVPLDELIKINTPPIAEVKKQLTNLETRLGSIVVPVTFSAAGAVAAGANGVLSGNTGALAVGAGALDGAIGGAGIGTAVGGPMGTVVGALIGTILGAITAAGLEKGTTSPNSPFADTSWLHPSTHLGDNSTAPVAGTTNTTMHTTFNFNGAAAQTNPFMMSDLLNKNLYNAHNGLIP